MERIQIGLNQSDPIVYVLDEVTGDPLGVEFPKEFRLRTVAHGLSLVNRFTGQTKEGYSVAEHSVRLRKITDSVFSSPILNRASLLHDAPECLGINDLHTQLKRLLAPKLRVLEEMVMERIWERFGDNSTWQSVESRIKPLDKDLGNNEFRWLFRGDENTPLSSRTNYLTPLEAEEAWGLFWYQDGGEKAMEVY